MSTCYIYSVEHGAATTIYAAMVPSVTHDAGEYFQDCHVQVRFASQTVWENHVTVCTLSESLFSYQVLQNPKIYVTRVQVTPNIALIYSSCEKQYRFSLTTIVYKLQSI